MHTDVQGRWVTCLIVQAEHAHRLSEVRGALESARIRHGGEVFQDPALLDRLCSTYPRPEAAVAAVHTLRDSLFGEAESAALPAQLRIAIAAGPFEVNDPWAPGSALERANGLLALAHGGQTLLTAETADLVGHALPAGTSLAALGTHRLRDLHNSIQVVQLRQPDGPVAFPPLRSLDVVPNNLPAQVTSFVGRRKAVSEVQEHLQTSRLVTLTGPGGSGKTRLALQVGAALLEQFPDGVWMVDLSNLTDPNLVPLAVAAALHVPDAPGRPPANRSARRWRPNDCSSYWTTVSTWFWPAPGWPAACWLDARSYGSWPPVASRWGLTVRRRGRPRPSPCHRGRDRSPWMGCCSTRRSGSLLKGPRRPRHPSP